MQTFEQNSHSLPVTFQEPVQSFLLLPGSVYLPFRELLNSKATGSLLSNQYLYNYGQMEFQALDIYNINPHLLEYIVAVIPAFAGLAYVTGKEVVLFYVAVLVCDSYSRGIPL